MIIDERHKLLQSLNGYDELVPLVLLCESRFRNRSVYIDSDAARQLRVHGGLVLTADGFVTIMTCFD